MYFSDTHECLSVISLLLLAETGVFVQLGVSFKMLILWIAPVGVELLTSSEIDSRSVRLVLEFIFHLFLMEELAGGAGNTSHSQAGIPYGKRHHPVNEETPWRVADGTPLPGYGDSAEFLDKYAVECSAEARQCYNVKGRMFWCTAC